MRGVTDCAGQLYCYHIFQLTRLMRGVTTEILMLLMYQDISTHTPHARRDSTGGQVRHRQNISTHTPHARRDRVAVRELPMMSISFQLTRLMRGVTATSIGLARRVRFQLTRLMRGVTKGVVYWVSLREISTHTPHARRDIATEVLSFVSDISTHTPHARRDLHDLPALRRSCLFQLTRLMRGVTKIIFDNGFFHLDFNSHASCEA